jgi:hypothetical protein
VTFGPPPTACVYKVKEEFDERVGPIGLCVIVACASLLLAWTTHFGFYFTKEKKVGSKKRFIND